MRGVTVLAVVLVACSSMAGATTHVRIVPAAASNPGLHGSHWSTELNLYNRAFDQEASIQVAFLPDADGTEFPQEVTVVVEPVSTLSIQDVVATLFGEHRPGALRLTSQVPFEASSRTFNDGAGQGSFGEGIPAVDPDDVLDAWVLMGAANGPGTAGVRTNLGLVNRGPWDAEVVVVLSIPATGEWFGPVTVDLGPYGWTQQDAFALFGISDRTVDGALVVGSFSGGVFGYLSRVDNRTGDGTFVLPVDGAIANTLPKQWDVTLTLTYSAGVEVYAIAYDGPGIPETVANDPVSGWTTDLTFTSPADLRYEVLGVFGAGGGTVEVEVEYSFGGGEPGRRVQRLAPGQAGALNLDGCFHME